MSEQEGWKAPRRLPLIVAAATLIVLTIGLIVGGRFYNATIAPATRPPRHAMADPALETFQTPPGEARLWHPTSPAGLDKAVAAQARKGDALWNEAQP